ncbi:carboxypeptidase-like regulatory domain-containing protein [Pedobacter sp. UBA4863]|uniref:carboxypeptidase-like regulatory domain-containing protein n=1 Tax=Pedobacter sp. UBA4863 TaxID=1947060 RepID=UPI0025E67597|nr:carboxypeptidase-like regulatory domain-containing protein [Pedobacter sp. UBA4863]
MKFYYQLLIVCIVFVACSKKSDTGAEGGNWGEQPALPTITGQANFTVSDDEYYINVMGNTIPRMPNFPSLGIKKGFARGYVADLNGKPLKGAHIGVRSTYIGGGYSSNTGTTNDNGYYEFAIPMGGASFFGTATTIDYNGTRAVVALYPEGGINAFASTDGIVKNFVLLSYGTANPDEVTQQPGNESNYYGGALYFDFNVNYPSGYQFPEYLPHNGVIEIELSPTKPGLYGETKSFKITRQIGNNSSFSIQNIPIGKYAINAKLSDGRQLNMKAVGPVANVYPNLGLKKDGAADGWTVTFTPNYQTTPVMVPAFKSNWDALSIELSL